MLRNDEVRRRRETLTLTMEEAAKRAGLASRQKWNDLEKTARDPRLSTLLALAQALQCSIADLVDEKYPPTRKRR